MAFKLIAILATLACVCAAYVPEGASLPYAAYESPIIRTASSHGYLFEHNYAPEGAVHHLHPSLLQQVSTPLATNYINPLVAVGRVVPQGKTTISKTFVSTPTYVTSHVSERVVAPVYHSQSYGKNAIPAVPSLPHAYDAQVQHGVGYGW